MAWTNVGTTPSGQVVPAADYNGMVGNLAILGNAWTSYSPVLTGATTNPTGYTSVGSYIQAGKLIIFRARISLGSTFGSGAYSLTLPVTPQGTFQFVDVIYLNAGTTYVRGMAPITTSATLALWAYASGASGAYVQATPTVPFTFTNGDTIAMHGVYEGL